jgi:molecular chaperone GrpE
MSTDPEKTDIPGEAPAPAASEPSPAAAAKPDAPDAATAKAEPAPPAPAEPTPEQKLADALTETSRIRDQLLRTAADFDNFRKRSRRSEDDALRRGREGMLKEMLPVFDNLERAVQHAEGAPEAQAVAAGLRMVLKQFVDTLDRVGIKRIVAVGKPFDPSHHEAIQQLESSEHPAGMVIAEVQAGYMMGEALIRPTMVVVSKGAPASDAPSA